MRGKVCKYIGVLLLWLTVTLLVAQDNIHIRTHSFGAFWEFPFVMDDVDYFNFNDDQSCLNANMWDGVVVPFTSSEVDTITFQYAPSNLTGNRYKVFQMYITTNDGRDITSKDEYTRCYVSINGRGCFPHYSGKGKIRGRGNSTWAWYDKKPYRLKLDESSPILGLGSNRDWLLLANYRDVTDLMNTFVFEAAAKLGMPYTNHTRYTEVFLNGNYIGLYQLTEQVEQGGDRVDIDKNQGILLSFDLDDGPELSPFAVNNFYSEVFRLPVCIKHPDEEDLTDELKDSIKLELAELESAIDNKNFSQVNKLMDLRTFVRYLILQELVFNVEVVAPRSIYIHKDVDGKWTMGPLWDFDAGFAFDWATMTTGHNYFGYHNGLVFGTDPYNHRGGYDANISPFFTRMFGNHGFVTLFKEEWNKMKASLIDSAWSEIEKYVVEMQQGTVTREFSRWPLKGKTFTDDLYSMREWLNKRVDFLNSIINGYPIP